MHYSKWSCHLRLFMINGSILKCQKIVKNAHHNFPEPKLTSSHSSFCQNWPSIYYHEWQRRAANLYIQETATSQRSDFLNEKWLKPIFSDENNRGLIFFVPINWFIAAALFPKWFPPWFLPKLAHFALTNVYVKPDTKQTMNTSFRHRLINPIRVNIWCDLDVTANSGGLAAILQMVCWLFCSSFHQVWNIVYC